MLLWIVKCWMRVAGKPVTGHSDSEGRLLLGQTNTGWLRSSGMRIGRSDG